jgi:hypothetical protein
VAERRGAGDRGMPPNLKVDDWMVDRPIEVKQTAQRLLRRGDAGTVGVTTALWGAASAGNPNPGMCRTFAAGGGQGRLHRSTKLVHYRVTSLVT